MTQTIVFEDGKLVLKEKKRSLEDEFKDDTGDDTGNDDDGFLIRSDFIEDTEEFVLTTGNYIEKHTINRRKNEIRDRPDNTKLSLETNTSKITLQRDDVKELSALGNQQKFALLARAAYFEGDEKQIDDLFSKVPILKNMRLDKELSTKKNSVFVDTNTGEVVIAYKGTNPTNIEDLYDDFEIVRSQENSTSRFQKAEELYQKVETKYGKDNIKITGHSLGGGISMYVGEKNDVETYSFNAGISAIRTLQSHKNNTNKSYVYHTSSDPVSIGVHLNQDSNREIIQVSQKNTVDPHGIDNFIKPKTHRTLEDVSNAVNNNPIMKIINGVAISELEEATGVGEVITAGKTVKEVMDVSNEINKAQTIDQEFIDENIEDQDTGFKKVANTTDWEMGF